MKISLQTIPVTVRVLGVVLRRPLYVFITMAVTFFIPTLIVVLQNANLILNFISQSDIALRSKILFIITLYQDLITSNGIFSFTSIIIVSLLFGIHISMVVFYIKKAAVLSGNTAAMSIPALISGFLGVGCAACGSFLPIFPSILGLSGLFIILPFEGKEFSILAILLLFIAIILLAQRINKPPVCLLE